MICTNCGAAIRVHGPPFIVRGGVARCLTCEQVATEVGSAHREAALAAVRAIRQPTPPWGRSAGKRGAPNALSPLWVPKARQA